MPWWGGLFKSPLRHRTQSEIPFRSLPPLAAGCRLGATEGDVSEAKVALCGTPTSMRAARETPGERGCMGGVCRALSDLLTTSLGRVPEAAWTGPTLPTMVGVP